MDIPRIQSKTYREWQSKTYHIYYKQRVYYTCKMITLGANKTRLYYIHMRSLYAAAYFDMLRARQILSLLHEPEHGALWYVRYRYAANLGSV